MAIEDAYYDMTLEKGTYIGWVRARKENAAGASAKNLRIEVIKDPAGVATTLANILYSDIPNTFALYTTNVFTVTDDDTVRIKCSEEGTDVYYIHLDYYLIFIVSNAHNWPLDLSHSAMRSTHLEVTPRK